MSLHKIGIGGGGYDQAEDEKPEAAKSLFLALDANDRCPRIKSTGMAQSSSGVAK